jgi:serine/threonine-protein kinase RsbW
MISLEVGTPVGEPLHLTLTSSPQELAGLFARFDTFAEEHGLSVATRGAVQLALEEIVVNVIKHGYREQPGQPITVEVAVVCAEVVACIEDAAPAFNPLLAPAPDFTTPLEQKEPGGLGIHLVKQMMDGVAYERVGEKNRLTVRKRV